MGINVDTTISFTFLLGGLMAGAAGIIYALYQTDVWFFAGFTAGLISFTAAVMGGIGNLQGRGARRPDHRRLSSRSPTTGSARSGRPRSCSGFSY